MNTNIFEEFLMEQCQNGELQAFIRKRMPTAGNLLGGDPFMEHLHEHVKRCRVRVPRSAISHSSPSRTLCGHPNDGLPTPAQMVACRKQNLSEPAQSGSNEESIAFDERGLA